MKIVFGQGLDQLVICSILGQIQPNSDLVFREGKDMDPEAPLPSDVIMFGLGLAQLSSAQPQNNSFMSLISMSLLFVGARGRGVEMGGF